MAISDVLVAEFQQEMKATRKLLEAVPEEHLGWKPHEKSMTLGRLAGHIAETPEWASGIVNDDVLDVSTVDSGPFNPSTVEELLAGFDANVKTFNESVSGVPDEHLEQRWKMTMGDQVLIDSRRGPVLRTWALNHLYHHRGQLTVYLRLLDIPLPPIYGPTADAQGF